MGYFGVLGTASTTPDPQMLFVEAFPLGGAGAFTFQQSQATFSVQAFNVPLSLSFNSVIMWGAKTQSTAGSFTLKFGLYSMNGSTLSLANSASGTYTQAASQSHTSWISLATSATQNITPGTWFAGILVLTGGTAANLFARNCGSNPGNALPFFRYGRSTASTTDLPISFATSDLDVTGQDALTQVYFTIAA